MADFEGVAAIRGARLADLSQHVADVLSVALAAGDEYVVGTLSLESYEFVPYALTGLAAAMQTPGAGEPRASTVVTVPIRDDKAGTGQAQRPVTLYGPGDVLGVDPGQVVRRYPSPGSVNAEETFHAHIEFDRPELPWTFSAQTPGNTMRPWLALVVLERSEVEWEPARAGLQPVMAVDADRLPPVSGTAAAPWAHAQVPKGPASLAARLSTAFAPVNVSRLLAARVLTQDTDYVACLVPTTDAGVEGRAGPPGRDPRRGLDPGRRPGAAAGLRPLGVPHRTGRRLRTAGPPARAAGGAVGDRPPDPGHLATRRPDRRPPRGSGRPPPGGPLRPGLAQRPAARRTRGRRRLERRADPGPAGRGGACRGPRGQRRHRPGRGPRPAPRGTAALRQGPARGRDDARRRLVLPAQHPPGEPGRRRARHPGGAARPGAADAGGLGAGRRDRQGEPGAAARRSWRATPRPRCTAGWRSSTRAGCCRWSARWPRG